MTFLNDTNWFIKGSFYSFLMSNVVYDVKKHKKLFLIRCTEYSLIKVERVTL